MRKAVLSSVMFIFAVCGTVAAVDPPATVEFAKDAAGKTVKFAPVVDSTDDWRIDYCAFRMKLPTGVRGTQKLL